MALVRPKSAKFSKIGPSISFKIRKGLSISKKREKALKKNPEMGHFSIIYRVFHKEWHFLGQNQLNFWKFTGWCINNGTFLVKIGQFFKKGPSINFENFLQNTSLQANPRKFLTFFETLVHKHFLTIISPKH